MRKFKDYTGEKFGRLECISRLSPASKGKKGTYWRCKCDCGNFVDVRIGSLLEGYTKSCGCLRREKLPKEDYTGQRFGRLECISSVVKDKCNNYWRCKCDCGNLVDMRIHNLLKGYNKSCGCLKKEKFPSKDLTGQRFGRLECIYKTQNFNNVTYWRCQCDCGNLVDVRRYSLLSGNTKSCGCSREKKIDYTGQKFGRLECMAFAGSVKNSTYWTCKCDCGNIINTRIESLVSGNTKSCGCLMRERLSPKDYTGQKFGRLECIEKSEQNQGKKGNYWKCQCDCGISVDININLLINGSKNSCGCIRRNMLDYTGQKFGHLECIQKSEQTRGNGVSWKCKCDCGRFIDVRLNSLVKGQIKSCGCLNSNNQPIK